MVRKILVPFELPDPEPLSPVLVEALASLDVVVLGHYSVPEQTPPYAARDEFEDEAEAMLDELAAPFEAAGADTTTRLVFGRDRGKTIDRVALEEGCVAELDPAPTDWIDRVLVPVPAISKLGWLPEFVGVLSKEGIPNVTLLHVSEGEETAEEGQRVLDDVRTAMRYEGFDEDRIETELVEAPAHDEAILEVAGDYDAVVMHEAEPSLRERIFGTLPDRIAERHEIPVVVVRRRRDEL